MTRSASGQAASATPSATSAAEVSLLVLCVAIGCLLPPFNARVLDNPALLTLLGITIAASLVLHLVFVALLARSLDRPATKYVVLALFTLPIGSIVGLVLLEWQARVGASGDARTPDRVQP